MELIKKEVKPRKINMRGTVSSLKVNEVARFPNMVFVGEEKGYKLSSLRSTLANITGDTGKEFTATTKDEYIIVTRTL